MTAERHRTDWRPRGRLISSRFGGPDESVWHSAQREGPRSGRIPQIGEAWREKSSPRHAGVRPYAQRTSTVKTWSSFSSEPPLARQPTGFPFSINGLL
jgi:hypothetical protein